MIKKLIGIVAAVVVIVVIVITVMHRDKFKSMVLLDTAGTPAALVAPAHVTSAPPQSAASVPGAVEAADSLSGAVVDSLR